MVDELEKMTFGLAPSIWERLKAVIAKAAPPAERAAAIYLDPVHEDAIEAARLNSLMEIWRRTVSGDDCTRTIDLLASLELTEAQVRDGFRSVVCKDRGEFPGWVYGISSFLATVLSGCVAQPDVPPDDAIAELRALHTQLIGIARFSIASVVGVSAIPVTDTAISDMAAMFARSAMKALGPSVTFEKNLSEIQARIMGRAAPLAVLDLSNEGWLYRLELRPGLAFVLGTIFHFWRQNVSECLVRLEADMNEISHCILDSAQLGELIRFKGGAGDPHDRGRGVAILYFSQDLKIVYKTKDLRGAVSFLDFAGHLNKPERPLDLKRQRILSRDGYGWEEFVTFRPCETTDEVSDYFARMGMLIRLLQLCGGRDFWLDNIVAHGANPYLIDLETLMQGCYTEKSHLSAYSDELRVILEESVLFTAAVVSHVLIMPGVQAEDMGGLTPYRRLRTPFKAQNGQDFLEWEPPDYAPFYKGKPSQINDYLEDLLAGYLGLNESIREHAPRLLYAEAATLEMLKMPVRHILRDTWSYYNIMDTSLLPQALEDGIARELSLCRLFKNWSGTLTHARIIAKEVEALRDLDIPLFRSKPDSRSLYSSNDECLGPYFDCTAFEKLCSRLTNAESFDSQLHLDILLSSLETGAAGPVGLTVPRLPTASQPVEDPAMVARAISRKIIDSRISARGLPIWLGLGFDTVNKVQVLHELSWDLLTGTLGLACTFAEVFQATGELEAAHISRALCDRIPEMDSEYAFHHSDVSRFFGPNAFAFTLAHCGAALKNTSLQDRACAMLANQADGFGGDLAGWLSANICLQTPLPMPCSLPDFSVLAIPSLFATGLPKPYASFVAEEGAALLAGLEAMHVAGIENAHASKLKTSLEGHYSDALQTRILGHGTLRALLSTRLLASVLAWIDEIGLTRDEPELSSRELLLRAQLALSAFSVTNDGRFKKDALQLASSLHYRNSVTGSWFPDRFAADRHNLSSLWGISSIARLFAGLAIPSLELNMS